MTTHTLAATLCLATLTSALPKQVTASNLLPYNAKQRKILIVGYTKKTYGAAVATCITDIIHSLVTPHCISTTHLFSILEITPPFFSKSYATYLGDHTIALLYTNLTGNTVIAQWDMDQQKSIRNITYIQSSEPTSILLFNTLSYRHLLIGYQQSNISYTPLPSSQKHHTISKAIQLLPKLHTCPVECLTQGPHNILLSASFSKRIAYLHDGGTDFPEGKHEIIAWNMHKKQHLTTFAVPQQGTVSPPAWISDTQFLIVHQMSNLYLYNIHTSQPCQTTPLHRQSFPNVTLPSALCVVGKHLIGYIDGCLGFVDHTKGTYHHVLTLAPHTTDTQPHITPINDHQYILHRQQPYCKAPTCLLIIGGQYLITQYRSSYQCHALQYI